MRFVPAGQILFEVDSVGKESYFLLEGQCSIYFKFKDPAEEQQKKLDFDKFELFKLRTMKKRCRSNFAEVAEPSTIMSSKVEYRFENYGVYYKEHFLKRGLEIKETDSIQIPNYMNPETSRRTVTALCEKDSHFLVISKVELKVRAWINNTGQCGIYPREG